VRGKGVWAFEEFHHWSASLHEGALGVERAHYLVEDVIAWARRKGCIHLGERRIHWQAQAKGAKAHQTRAQTTSSRQAKLRGAQVFF
jgi:hypothetical protein